MTVKTSYSHARANCLAVGSGRGFPRGRGHSAAWPRGYGTHPGRRARQPAGDRLPPPVPAERRPIAGGVDPGPARTDQARLTFARSAGSSGCWRHHKDALFSGPPGHCLSFRHPSALRRHYLHAAPVEGSGQGERWQCPEALPPPRADARSLALSCSHPQSSCPSSPSRPQRLRSLRSRSSSPLSPRRRFTTTVVLSLALAPWLSVTTSLTLNSPRQAYVWLGLGPVPKLPSPKVHL